MGSPDTASRGKVPGLSVAMIAPEMKPFAKTGGLGDVTGALPAALRRLGLDVSLIMPAYRPILRGGLSLEDTGTCLQIMVGERREDATVLRTTTPDGVPVSFIKADRYFDRGYLYGTPEGDYPDNIDRFTFFCRAALEVLAANPPDVIHAHDWQSALVPFFLGTEPERYPSLSRTRSVLTVHNLGYQGLFPRTDWPKLGIDRRFFTPEYLEFWGKINLLKGGLVTADALTTVSPTYAGEIKTAEQGFGLDGVFRERAGSLLGILNGADYTVWNPESDPYLAARFGPGRMAGKARCKAALQHDMGLPVNPKTPLAGMVSRLAAQKGFDLLAESLPDLFDRDIQLAILGSGDEKYQAMFSGAARRNPGRLAVRIAFDEALSHRIIAGADLLLMPSLYEPGGLTQLYGFKYGTVPVVRATGGIKDTVTKFEPDTGQGNGFVFGPYRQDALLAAIDRAISLFGRPEQWQRLMANGMSADFSWERSARRYLGLYQSLTGRP